MEAQGGVELRLLCPGLYNNSTWDAVTAGGKVGAGQQILGPTDRGSNEPGTRRWQTTSLVTHLTGGRAGPRPRSVRGGGSWCRSPQEVATQPRSYCGRRHPVGGLHPLVRVGSCRDRASPSTDCPRSRTFASAHGTLWGLAGDGRRGTTLAAYRGSSAEERAWHIAQVGRRRRTPRTGRRPSGARGPDLPSCTGLSLLLLVHIKQGTASKDLVRRP